MKTEANLPEHLTGFQSGGRNLLQFQDHLFFVRSRCFPMLASIVTQSQVQKRLGKTNLDHFIPRTESNPVFFFSTSVCTMVLNPAGDRIFSLYLCTSECNFP